jgi:putative N6-adenine-specific DNA methylase
LHKRGYRAIQGKAPLSEVLAAGMILLIGLGWFNRFYRSHVRLGTLPIEAAMIAQNIPPGRFRKSYAFENWQGYNQELFDKIKVSQKIKHFTKKFMLPIFRGKTYFCTN